ncbi:MAG TPA: carboxypeptidase-like regulatory domain-containing protein, partial [Blastocatellia bacterium]|nr:carboxypeptidase-like regulatory domain-containing protein [Blastocatellia bacterium]
MRIFTTIAISGAILLGAAPDIRAGQAPGAASREATCAITGRVSIDNEGAPGVAVVLQPALSSFPLPPPVARATTDKEGRFQMNNLPDGRYYLVPLAAAYFAPSEDRMIASGKPVTLMKGETLDGIELKLIPGGVITGRVTTAGGQPAVGQNIFIRAIDPRAEQQLPSTTHSDQRFRTDDRGVYRIYGLPAGRFTVSVHSDMPGQAIRIFHPGVTEESQAAPVDVVAGKVVENVDIKLAPHARRYEASGRVIDESTGRPIPRIGMDWNAFEANSKSGISYGSSLQVDEQGVFRLPNLAPGHYSVKVAISGSSEYYSDEVVFDVTDQDVTGLEIRARRAASLSGVVVIEGARDPSVLSEMSDLRVLVNRTAGGMGISGPIGADGRFRITGLPPDKFRFNLSWRTRQRRFSLLGAERDGVRLPDWIEVAAGEQVTGLRLIVAFGAGVVRGQVQIVGGTLPEGARLSVSARRADLPDRPGSASSVTVDARGRFLIEGLTTGVHEISLMVFVP